MDEKVEVVCGNHFDLFNFGLYSNLHNNINKNNLKIKQTEETVNKLLYCVYYFYGNVQVIGTPYNIWIREKDVLFKYNTLLPYNYIKNVSSLGYLCNMYKIKHNFEHSFEEKYINLTVVLGIDIKMYTIFKETMFMVLRLYNERILFDFKNKIEKAKALNS